MPIERASSATIVIPHHRSWSDHGRIRLIREATIGAGGLDNRRSSLNWPIGQLSVHTWLSRLNGERQSDQQQAERNSGDEPFHKAPHEVKLQPWSNRPARHQSTWSSLAVAETVAIAGEQLVSPSSSLSCRTYIKQELDQTVHNRGGFQRESLPQSGQLLTTETRIDATLWPVPSARRSAAACHGYMCIL
jgi:hypothetical protein